MTTIINRSPSSSSSNSSSSVSPKFHTNSPPVSPSFLRVNDRGDYFRQPAKDEFVFTTRSSSLNRATNSSSGKSIVHLSPQRVPPSPNKALFSNPTSPLAFEMTTLHESLNGGEQEFPNHALFSYISTHFIQSVATLNQHRKIFCTEEYPMSFNGEEAVVQYIMFIYLVLCFNPCFITTIRK